MHRRLLAGEATVIALAPHEWWWPARLLSVVDGDTYNVVVDRGVKDFSEWRIRPIGIDSPERKAATMDAWRAARDFAASWLLTNDGELWSLRLHSITGKLDSFGRYLCDVYRYCDGANLSDDMLTSGHALGFLR